MIASIVFALVLLRADTVRIASEVTAQSSDLPRFRLLYGSFYGDSATYTLQTPPEEKNYADDCIGCEQEVGNAVIFAELGCRNVSEHLFESNSKGDIVEKATIVDSSGKTVGESRIAIFKEKDGKIVGGRMFWIEGNDFWSVQAPTVELTKALRESPQYKEVRETVVKEIKKYIPIQNANTIGKDPCKRGLTQKRVTH